MPPHELAGARAKVERAHKHIDEFREAQRVFLQSHPYSFAHRQDPVSGDIFVYVEGVKATPLELCTIVGDTIHNLRSALDLLACQLLKAAVISHDCSEVRFPVSSSVKQFERALHAGTLSLIGGKALDELRKLEPYAGGQGAELWLLHRLDIQDKHRLLVIPYAGIRQIICKSKFLDAQGLDIPSSAWEGAWSVPAGGFHVAPKGSPIFGVRPKTFPVPPGGQMRVDITTVGDVVFNEPGIVEGKPVTQTLEGFAELVGAVLSQFECFFSGAASQA